MKVLTKLSDDQKELLLKLGHIFNDNGQLYFHLPFWFKQLEGGEFELLRESQLPANLKAWLNEKRENLNP